MAPVGLARVAVATVAACVAVLPVAAASAGAAGVVAPPLVVFVDRDDDDGDGVPDGEQATLPRAARADLVPLEMRFVGKALGPPTGDGRVRIVAPDGNPWPWEKPLPAGAALQGLAPGGVYLPVARAAPLSIQVVGVRFVDATRRPIDAAREHLSLDRLPPRAELGRSDTEEDAFSVLLELPRGLAAPPLVVASHGASGLAFDVLPELALSRCGDGDGCLTTVPLRLVSDDVDRTHPLAIGRSLRGEVGGAVVVRALGRKQAIRVAGPRKSSAGPIGRLRATLRPIVLRVVPGGAPAIGGTDPGAVAALRSELGVAASIWGQCGVTFGDVQSLDVRIVDPPPAHLLSLGHDLGLPTSGGELRFRADDKTFVVPLPAGAFADRVAVLVSAALARGGFVPITMPNPRIGPGAAPSVDVSVRRRDGSLASLDLVPGAALSTDASLSAAIGSVDLSNGLSHFGDMDAMAGTLEERTLLKALDDGDPQTLEIVVVPFFSGSSGRIGESFIGADGTSLRNVVVLDRAGVRARKSSLTLAHELGHVLLDAPGHPDDFGADTPTLLMDSDASDASAFGPRRLTTEECARVLRQSGPGARLPLLREWPLGPLRLR